MMPALTPLISRLHFGWLLRPISASGARSDPAAVRLELLDDVVRVVANHLVTALEWEVAHELAHAPAFEIAHLLQHFRQFAHDTEAFDDFGRDEAPLVRSHVRVVALVHDLLAL